MSLCGTEPSLPAAMGGWAARWVQGLRAISSSDAEALLQHTERHCAPRVGQGRLRLDIGPGATGPSAVEWVWVAPGHGQPHTTSPLPLPAVWCLCTWVTASGVSAPGWGCLTPACSPCRHGSGQRSVVWVSVVVQATFSCTTGTPFPPRSDFPPRRPAARCRAGLSGCFACGESAAWALVAGLLLHAARPGSSTSPLEAECWPRLRGARRGHLPEDTLLASVWGIYE